MSNESLEVKSFETISNIESLDKTRNSFLNQLISPLNCNCIVLEEQKNNPNFFIYDIAGNETIALTYKEKSTDKSPYENSNEVLRYKEIEEVNDKGLLFLDRVTTLVSVTSLPLFYQILQSRGISIDHFYDY